MENTLSDSYITKLYTDEQTSNKVTFNPIKIIEPENCVSKLDFINILNLPSYATNH